MVQGIAVLRRRDALMKPFSRTRDTYTGSFLVRRRRKRLALGLSLLAILALAGGIFTKLHRSGALAAMAATRPVPKKSILAAWEEGKYADVRATTIGSLSSAPLDPFYLTFRGFAAYYQAIELPEGEERAALEDEAIVALRKALIIGVRLPKPQVEYVLGKAYYGKGPAYYDLSVKFLEAAIGGGYQSVDGREYLALAYSGLGDRVRSVANFDEALRHGRSEMLLLAAAKGYSDAGDASKAEALLLEALSSGKDALARQQCRLLLGEIYRSRGDIAKAEEQYSFALEKEPDSAEVHYSLGLVYHDKGDPVKARAEWRKAVTLDPMHAAARQKLSEKL